MARFIPRFLSRLWILIAVVLAAALGWLLVDWFNINADDVQVVMQDIGLNQFWLWLNSFDPVIAAFVFPVAVLAIVVLTVLLVWRYIG